MSTAPTSGSKSRSNRMPEAYRWLDHASGALILFLVVFTPWAFGCTVSWAIWTACGGCYALGAIAIARALYCRLKRYDPPSWVTPDGARWPIRTMAALTAVLVTYAFTSALNARASVEIGLDTARLAYRDYLPWLPHSYDASASMRAAWRYLALACFFWASRQWFSGLTWRERHPAQDELARPEIPGRIRTTLWFIAISSALLALVSVLQRAGNTDRLLWLMPMRSDNGRDLAFGPYSYRANASQYFNLVWPLCLGFWWSLQRDSRRRFGASARIGSEAHTMLIPCLSMLFLAPLIAASRGGVLILAVQLGGALALLALLGGRGGKLAALAVGSTFAAVALVGWLVAGGRLSERFATVFTDKLSGRGELYEVAHRMADDFVWLGSGPESFTSLYGLYRTDVRDSWEAYAHDDYLETRVTFGRAGFALILALLACVPAQAALGRAIPGGWAVPAFGLLGILGVLIHAKFDFPFQIFSIHLFFLLVCAILSCLRLERT